MTARELAAVTAARDECWRMAALAGHAARHARWVAEDVAAGARGDRRQTLADADRSLQSAECVWGMVDAILKMLQALAPEGTVAPKAGKRRSDVGGGKQ